MKLIKTRRAATANVALATTTPITRFVNSLLMRQARVRAMIDRELARERPSALRLMRMKRLVLALRHRLDALIEARRSPRPLARRPRLVPVPAFARVH